MPYTLWNERAIAPWAVVGLLGMSVAMGGCAGTRKPAVGDAGLPPSYQVAQLGNNSPTVSSAAGRDLSTASDETDLQKRARIRMELALGYYGRGQLNTALDEVKQAIALDDRSPDAFELRGLIYDAMNEPRLAEESFKRALQFDERNGSVLHNYAWFLCRRQQYAAADAYFVRATELAITAATPKAFLARGVCQMQAGLLPDAEKNLLRSYELAPSNPATAFNLALVFYRKGDYERARFYIRRVNGIPEQANPESLWLGIRIENKLGNMNERAELASQLRSRFPNGREVTALELGRFDD